MEFSIRDARTEDMPAVLGLIQELADFEKEPDAVEIGLEELQTAGFGPQPAFHCMVAEMEERIVGLALVYPRFSTWKGKVIHLEDLIVTQSARGLGIGGALLDEVVRYGHAQGAQRISWEVIDWNEPAISFYEKRGARILRDWDVVKLEGEGLEAYIRNLEL